MNENHYDNPDAPKAHERQLERLLHACRLQPVDNTRIKSLVHEKIQREAALRRARLRRAITGWASVAACIAVIVAVGISFINRSNVDLRHATQAEVAEAGYTELIVGKGKRQEVTLPDGSRLIANANTRVLYPERFEGAERRIYAFGEVYLEVAKDKEHPFVVESTGFDVKVLGTRFNIANTSDSTASVVLVEGAVEVLTGKDKSVKMRPNDMLGITNGEVTSLTRVDTGDYTSWIDGLLCLHGESMTTVTRKLSEHYGIEISCDRALSRSRIYGKLDLHDSIDQVLQSIDNIVPMKITKEGNRIILKNDAMK